MPKPTKHKKPSNSIYKVKRTPSKTTSSSKSRSHRVKIDIKKENSSKDSVNTANVQTQKMETISYNSLDVVPYSNVSSIRKNDDNQILERLRNMNEEKRKHIDTIKSTIDPSNNKTRSPNQLANKTYPAVTNTSNPYVNQRRHAIATLSRRRAEDDARIKAEAKRKADLEAKRREEEAKRKAEAEAKRKADLEAKRKAELEAKRKAELEDKRKAELEAKRKAELEAKRKEVEERKEEARRKFDSVFAYAYSDKLNLVNNLNSFMLEKPTVLYVTSFNEEMYHLSGKDLFKSFISTQQEDKLLICYEGFDFTISNEKIFSYPLINDPSIKEWVEKLDVDDPDDRFLLKQIKKIFSIDYAYKTYHYFFDYIVWVDSDCEFISTIPLMVFPALLNGRSMFYYYGEFLEFNNLGCDTAIIGFNTNHPGTRLILDEWIGMFDNNKFKNFVKNDNGFLLSLIIKEYQLKDHKNEVTDLDDHLNKPVVLDLAWSGAKDPINNPNSIFAPYIKHKTGIHVLGGIE